MIKTQVQIPDELYERAKRMAKAKEWSFAELVRRGLEQMTARQPMGGVKSGGWQLPAAVDLGRTEDPFERDDWREEANLGSGAAEVIAARLREDARRYEAGQ